MGLWVRVVFSLTRMRKGRDWWTVSYNCKSSDFFLLLLNDPNLFFKNLLALLSNLVFPTLYISIDLFSYGANPATVLTVLTIFSILAFIPDLLWLGLLLVILVAANPLFKPMLSP